MKKLVIFDLDGTLLDTSSGLNLSMNFALKSMEASPISNRQTKDFVGSGSLKYAQLAIGEQRASEADLCHTLFLQHYRETGIHKAIAYQGVKDLLCALKRADIKTAVLSNKPHAAAVEMCKKFFPDHKFDIVLGHQEGTPLKPHPQALHNLLSALSVPHSDAVLVGDGEADVQTAVSGGIDHVSVLWGFRSKKQLKAAGAKYFADRPDDLLNLILYHFERKKMKKLFGEFKTFITKGNVLDMAVGVIIGSAFSAIVNSLVKDVITPVISLVTGGVDLNELKAVLTPAVVETVDGVETVTTPALTLNYGTFIEAIINFLLIAITIFIFVKVVARVRKTLDYNETMRSNIQKKLDNDESLNKLEEKWMTRMKKKAPGNIPAKTPATAPAEPPKPSSTDQLLMQILDELKKNN